MVQSALPGGLFIGILSALPIITIGNRASSPLRYVLGFLCHFFGGIIFATLGGVLGAIFYSPYGRSETAS